VIAEAALGYARSMPPAVALRTLGRSGARRDLTPARVGIGLAVALLSAFVALELALGRHRLLTAETDLRDVRLALLHAVLLAYLPAAYLSVVRRARETLRQLGPLLAVDADALAELEAGAGRYPRSETRVAGLIGVALATLAPFLTPGPMPWQPSEWGAVVGFQRALSLPIGWWAGRLAHAALIESGRLSELASRLRPIDLFDLGSLAPFARSGLGNALLVAGFTGICALFLFEQGLAPIVAAIAAVTLASAIAGLLLPVRGLRARIREAKRERLGWCGAALAETEARLRAERRAEDLARIADLLAYREHVMAVREWPFDLSAFLRVALYLSIPLGSWAGAALVERLLDRLLGG
jgi:hypothetical protein